jgi:hypothetical protein
MKDFSEVKMPGAAKLFQAKDLTNVGNWLRLQNIFAPYVFFWLKSLAKPRLPRKTIST